MRHVDHGRLIAAIDELHKLAWGRGEMGHGPSHRAADALARSLGWDGDDGTTPDGPWLRAALEAELR